jgi:hypothetical protein
MFGLHIPCPTWHGQRFKSGAQHHRSVAMAERSILPAEGTRTGDRRSLRGKVAGWRRPSKSEI